MPGARSQFDKGNQEIKNMLKLILIGIILIGLFVTASEFREVETYQEAIPKVKELGGKSINSMESTYDYGKSLIEIWNEDRK